MNSQRTPTFLMANLGSEMSQLFQFKNNNQIDMARGSAERAYKIIDSITVHSDSGQGKKEAEILRTIIRDLLLEKPQLNISKEGLDSYFKPFAMRMIP